MMGYFDEQISQHKPPPLNPQIAEAMGYQKKFPDLPTRTTPLVVTIPMPPKATHPNSRARWQAKARTTKQQRREGATAARAALGTSCPPRWKRATVQATWHKPGKRAKLADEDGLQSHLKATMDSFQDAGIIINDSGFTWLPPVQLLGAEATESKVVIVITPIINETRKAQHD